ncbi:hypothetical protein RUMHYD_00029 [Blautia hydrogenotrophica DSM 10507]|uniref:Uncharacterized protein n=1 Tax=Blautia hydrogenotrophica (strain DSM 10507 / JCM 14656 / S5a33) TaxID=476272 RepID=C0CGR6_BLAHS|nr:hypothetical protein RUMHYD_00029 [Blautia hydrogenotrophica DSM 10507]
MFLPSTGKDIIFVSCQTCEQSSVEDITKERRNYGKNTIQKTIDANRWLSTL